MAKKKYHMINELPHIYELEDMIEFCRKYEHLYIYGRNTNQEYLLKYLDMCGILADGYTVSRLNDSDKKNFQYREASVESIESVIRMKNTGVILALPDRFYGQIIPFFRKNEFTNYFIMSEYNKRIIAEQVAPRDRENLTFEVSLADHCNLSCQMCDHYSQLSEEWFVDMGQFRKDMMRMGQLFDHKIAAISLLGGEPTLHPNLIDCIKITREQFPEAEVIVLTNGVLLTALEHSPQGNFWQVCKENDIHITVTVYPIKIDYEAIEAKSKEYGVPVMMSSNIHAAKSTKIVKVSDKHTMDLAGNVEKFYCISCLYFNKFNVLKDGRLYMCPIAAHSNIFNEAFNQKLKLEERDSLDIYEIESWKEIAEFTCQYRPFCSYCDLKHWGPFGNWKASTKKIDEYVGE